MAHEGESTGSSVVWAVALVVIVAIIAYVVISGGGFFGGAGEKKINVDISAPAR